jgi:ABC-type bacteriocin/lantibiotic exporter with double-glycine peptidase domain
MRALAIAWVVLGAGCSTGAARDVSTSQAAHAARDPAWRIAPGVPFVAQKSSDDCGPAALAMVLGHFGRPTGVDEIVARAPPADGGVTAGALRDLAREKGLAAFVVSGTLADLCDQVGRGRPVLVGLAKPIVAGRARAHYEVVVGVNRNAGLIWSLDPARGLRENTFDGFAREWVPTHQVAIIVLPRLSAGSASPPIPTRAPAG